MLLVDELDNCKGKGNAYADRHIKEIQDAYKQDQEMKKPMMEDKGKQWVQDEEVFLYKLYDVAPFRPKIPEPMFIQNKINNLENYMKYIQSSVSITPFYPPSHYKAIWPQREQDKQYWKEIAVEFLRRKYNTDTTRKEFPIKMYIEEPPHELVLTLQGGVVIGPTKKLVAFYVVGDLTLLN